MSRQEKQEILEGLLSKYNSQTRVLALTILGIALNSLFALPAYQAVFDFLYQKTMGTNMTTMLSVFFLLNILITLVYCWAASLAFHPKRLINPFYLQLASAGLVTIFIVVANVKVFNPNFTLFDFTIVMIILTAIVELGPRLKEIIDSKKAS